MRYSRSDVLSALRFVGLEPSSDRAGIMQELIHEDAQFIRLVVSSGAEHVDVVETSVEKVVSMDWQSVSHDEGSGNELFKGLGFGCKLGQESGPSVFNIKVVTLGAVGSKADLVDEVDHCVHDGEKDLLNLLALLELFRVVRDEEPCSSNSSNYCDGFSHLVVEIHPVLRSIVLSFEPFWAVVHVVGELSITGDLLVCFSNLHP